MPPVTLVSNEYILVEYNPEAKLISHTIHQPIGPEQATMFADALDAGTEALKKYGLSKWLSDDRKNGPLPAQTMQWAFEDWQPRTIAAGWKYWANIVPTQLVAAGSLVPVIDNLHKLGLRMQVFENLEDGYKWLASL